MVFECEVSLLFPAFEHLQPTVGLDLLVMMSEKFTPTGQYSVGIFFLISYR